MLTLVLRDKYEVTVRHLPRILQASHTYLDPPSPRGHHSCLLPLPARSQSLTLVWLRVQASSVRPGWPGAEDCLSQAGCTLAWAGDGIEAPLQIEGVCGWTRGNLWRPGWKTKFSILLANPRRVPPVSPKRSVCDLSQKIPYWWRQSAQNSGIASEWLLYSTSCIISIIIFVSVTKAVTVN